MPLAAARDRRQPARLKPARRFHFRAALYGRLDAHLWHKTRFFGAACVTNRILGQLGSVTGSLLCSVETQHWLATTGALLERRNLAIASAVASGALTGPSLDGRIVAIEQSVVEEALQSPGAAVIYPRIKSELNALLNHRCPAAWLHLRPEVSWYRRVLAGVRTGLDSPLDFSSQAHREAIGMALIAALRRADRPH